MREGYYYIASPYSHADAEVVQQRFEAAVKASGRLMQANLIVFSPIAHSHPIALASMLPGDFGYWERGCKVFVAQSIGIVVLKLAGWRESRGVTAEIAIAKKLGLPVFYMPANELGNLEDEHVPYLLDEMRQEQEGKNV